MCDYEGYLLLHTTGHTADPLYFTLANGLFEYYSKKGGKWLGQLVLTKHRITVKAKADSISPNRFYIMTVPARSKYVEPQEDLPQCVILELGASTRDVRRQWLQALHSWRRTNWKESQQISSYPNELGALKIMMRTHNLHPKITKSIDRTLSNLTMVSANEVHYPKKVMPNSGDLSKPKLLRYDCTSFHHFRNRTNSDFNNFVQPNCA